MGIFSNKPKGTREQISLVNALDSSFELILNDLNAYQGFIQTFIERAYEIERNAQKPIMTWATLDEVCEKCKMELILIFSLEWSCSHLMRHTGHLRMRGFKDEAQDLAVRLDELRNGIELYVAKVLDLLVPVDQDKSSGMLGYYYCSEVIQEKFDFSETMREKYGKLDEAMRLHFGFKN
jgi:hypothetical protein